MNEFTDEELLAIAGALYTASGKDFRRWKLLRKVDTSLSPTVYYYQTIYKKFESEIIKRGISIELP